MKIYTERLEIVALTARQLELWIDDTARLEEELDCQYMAEPMEGIFKEIVIQQLKATQQDEKNYAWHSFWFIIRKADRSVVGSIDFKDVPNENGETEIGYGLGKEFEHSGYMTETVRALCDWATAQRGVRHIIAETDVDGLASQKILERCGFQIYERGETLWWRL